jgi:hypothetical protein
MSRKLLRRHAAAGLYIASVTIAFLSALSVISCAQMAMLQ